MGFRGPPAHHHPSSTLRGGLSRQPLPRCGGRLWRPPAFRGPRLRAARVAAPWGLHLADPGGGGPGGAGPMGAQVEAAESRRGGQAGHEARPFF
jgi:hypothetical protein